MRRIMMSAMRDNKEVQFIDRPMAEAYVLKIPEPDSGNSGPTGFVGVADYVRSRQELAIEVERSGDFVSYNGDDGARFTVEPDFLRDDDEDDVVDDLNPMGGERKDIPVLTQTLTAVDNDVQLSSPRIIKLEKWAKLTADRGNIGLLGVARWTGSGNAPTILFWTLNEYNDHGGLPIVNCQWDYNATLGMSPTETSTQVPGFDMVELDDGSIVVVFSTNNALYFYKSYDCGSNWVKVGEITGLTTDRYWVALDRIGSRLVVVYSRTWAGPNYGVYSSTSDDGGFTWSSADTVTTEAQANSEVNLDLARGQDGVMYLVFNRSNVAYVSKTLDGQNWSTPITTGVDADAGLSISQEYHGLWALYSTDVLAGTEIGLTEQHADDEEGAYTANWTSGGVVANGDADGDGLDDDQISARFLNDSGFLDVVVLKHDNHSGTDYYGLQVYRLAMWCGVQFDSAVAGWSVVWTPHAYPSTNDGHPNLNLWTEVTGTGAIANGSENDFYHMEITNGAATNKNYRWPAAGTDGWYDSGATVRFEMKAVSGRGGVDVRLTSAGSNASVHFALFFYTDRIVLYDVHAAAIVQTFTPTNWDPSDWSEYVIIAIENEMQLFRAPSSNYREIAHYELTVSSDTLQEDAYAGAGDSKVQWGSSAFGGTVASESHWRSMMVTNEDAFDVDWDFSACVGKKCHYNPVGILQGIACKWTGNFAIDGDTWEFDVGAQFDVDNILVASPRICFADPEDSSARSGTIVIDWRRHEGDEATCMNFAFDSIAVFGLNMPLFKLEGGDFAGTSWTTIWCNNYGNRGGPFVYEPSLAVIGTPDQNVVRFGSGASNLDEWPLPNQFASTEFRKWYVVFIGGTCNGNIYRIDGNNPNRLFLERNVESDGVADGDLFTIFSDRFLHIFDQQYRYPRVRLTLNVNNLTPSPSEDTVKVGTVVLGQTYDLPNDEWESSITTEAGVEVTTGRARIDQWREVAPERRKVDLTYTGRVDRGMGVDIVSELYRHARWGVHPVVWIDDDTALTPCVNTCSEASEMSHTDPILARVGGPMTRRRKFYSYEEQDGTYHIRGVGDVGGLVLEEVL